MSTALTGAQPPRPAYIPADEQPHEFFGFKTSTEHYLNGFHLEALRDAEQGEYRPVDGDHMDEITRGELLAAGLITKDNAITGDGRWYLADRHARRSV